MANAYPPLKKPNSALQPLGALVGEWELAVVFPADPSKVISGKVVFEWLENGAYLVMRSQPDSGLPESVSVIGSDEASDNFLMLYFDSRDVAQAYQMSFKDGVWKIWGTAKDLCNASLESSNKAAVPSPPSGKNRLTTKPGSMISI